MKEPAEYACFNCCIVFGYNSEPVSRLLDRLFKQFPAID